jgi:hypothetical protein
MSGIEEILSGYEGLRADQEAFYRDLARPALITRAAAGRRSRAACCAVRGGS